MRLHAADEELFGWDPTPGIVSVWADQDGQAIVWQREHGRVNWNRVRFRPWLYATSIADIEHVGGMLARADTPLAAFTSNAPFCYAELPAVPDTCRILITARNGRTLARALLGGAERRLGHPVRSLYHLDSEYYRVGPVEQYLIASGRVYFRGMSYADLHRMQIDFETTALDPQRGRIFMAAVRDNRGLATVLEARDSADEAALLQSLCALICERDPDVIENHNLFGFDLPFLEARAEALGVALSLGRAPGPQGLMRLAEPPPDDPDAPRQHRYTLAGRELIDTLDAVRRHDFVTRDLPSHRLKDVARHFGIASTERVYIGGAELYDTYCRTPERVRRYALDDVAEVDGLSRRLLVATFALAGMAPRRYERLANAGPAMGILEPMLVRAYARAGAAIPCPRAPSQAFEPHAGGALHLFASGVAQHVVKADVASLYPSLMIRFAIGPACDRLGVLLRLVGRLTELRLAHKQAARQALPGSAEADYHHAMQAAMKLLVNSAYGYLGAGSMALFADRAAADEVTRRGREILDTVVGELRARGVALIEADTDGVYFAVPADWNETAERRLVAEVAATLPDGIRLEYEGRYQAMFSHEVKNYALLTYGGDLIVRGAALRSSRSEPFGAAFLQQALRYLLHGNVDSVRQAFERTVAAVRNRELPAADMATRVRLSKTPAEYFARERRQREAGYEALIGAGRRSWARGERVRFYRNSAGAYVWLPDEQAEQQINSDAADYGDRADLRDYDQEYYIELLTTSYAGRLRKAFAPADFDQLFRANGQIGLFDRPVADIGVQWIECASGKQSDQGANSGDQGRLPFCKKENIDV
jgi:DNA polymerase elongation subunit (family B)